MTSTIDISFVKQFEADVHMSYQQQGSKLKGTVRSKDNIKGISTTFQKIGKGTASTKARHGLVPIMDLEHTRVECTLSDYYAGEWIDSLDELKQNIDERQAAANAGAYALGRKTDELIITALSTSSNSIGDYSAGLSKDLILSAFESLNTAEVPDDGQRYGIVGAHQWNELLSISEFSNSDYVGEAYPWLKGTESRKWLGIVWMMHTGLPVTDTTKRDCFIFHKSALGHACGQEVKTDVSWHGDHSAFFVCNSMSQGACLIDTAGAIKLKCDDDA